MTVLLFLLAAGAAYALFDRWMIARERIARARSDAELCRNSPGIYTARVVELAITGALIAGAGVETEHAEHIAELTMAELASGIVNDGRTAYYIDALDAPHA